MGSGGAGTGDGRLAIIVRYKGKTLLLIEIPSLSLEGFLYQFIVAISVCGLMVER